MNDSMPITILTESEIRQCVALDGEAIAAVEEAFVALADGRAVTPPIMRIDIWGRDRNELLDDTGKRAMGLYGAKVYAVEVKFVRTVPELKRGSKARVYFPRPVREDIDR